MESGNFDLISETPENIEAKIGVKTSQQETPSNIYE